MKICSVPGCGKKHVAKGYCMNHYMKWKRRGDATAETLRFETPEEAFAARTEWWGDCLIWTGSLNNSGYGAVSVNGTNVGAHRYAWEREHGPIPKGKTVDHKVCYNRACVNVAHLRLATHNKNNFNKSGAYKQNRSGYRNVFLYKDGRWAVQITKQGKRYWFGLHDNIEEAARVAEEKRKELFGEFAGRG